jgi:hypothetical protein
MSASSSSAMRRTPGHFVFAGAGRTTREARADFAELHPKGGGAPRATLAGAQLVFARSYGASSSARIVQCCQLIDAIWDDDLETVRRLVTANRHLLIENAGIGNDNWGPPMTYAANLGRDRIIRLLYDPGARDRGCGRVAPIPTHARPWIRTYARPSACVSGKVTAPHACASSATSRRSPGAAGSRSSRRRTASVAKSSL